MGAINNAFNQAAGAVAIAGRMIGHEKESAISRGEAAKNEDIELEAKLVSKKIKDLVDSKFQVYDRKKETFRNIKYSDIIK